MFKPRVSNPLVVPFSASALALLAIVLSPTPAQSKSGSVTGTVQFSGEAPVAKLDMSSDGYCARKKRMSEELVVTKGMLKDVHVRIKAGTAGKHKAPTTPVVVEQDGCVYRPHVAGAMVGQPIAIKNKDKTMHNVHAYVGSETWFNRSQPKGAPDIVETDTGEAGEVFELKCNVHAWMHNYMPISDHPYFDVTGTDGKFEIKNLPAGEYTLEAWHPKLGLKSTKIRVKGASAKADFRFP